MAVRRTKWKNSAVIEQPKKDVFTVTMKAAEETGAQATLLDRSVKAVG